MPQPSRRSTPLPPHWPRLRKQIARRDNHTCRACGLYTLQGEVDHITPSHKWPSYLPGAHDPSNLQYLCKPCHQAKTLRETPTNHPRKRPPEPHPATPRPHP